MAEHIPDELAARYAEDPESVAERASIEEHLSICVPCTSLVNDVRAFVSALRDEETWWLAEEVAESRGRDRIRDFVAKCAAEDAEAERFLEPFLESQYRFTYANIGRKKRFHTGGVVRLLCKAAREECGREPLFAVTLTETACLIAEALPENYYPASAVDDLRGTAWKEASTAYRLCGRLDAAFDALNRAERAYRRLSDGGIQLATVDLCRAILYWERKQYDEALRYARSAAMVFTDRRDTGRYVDAIEWEAIILHSSGNIGPARATYMSMYELADTLGDAEMKARAANNIAIAYRDSGDTGSASKFYAIALQLYTALEYHAMIVSVRRSLARLSLYAGNPAEAARQLPSIIEELQRLGMINYAAHAQLDLAEAYLLLGRYAEVESVCTRLIAFYRDAEMITGALTAASYLKEATQKRAITPEHFAYVRCYLASLEASPDLPFAPPPPHLD